LQGFLLQVEVSQIIVHEADEPNAVVDFLNAFFAKSIAPFAAMLDRFLRLEQLPFASALQYAAEHSMKKEELEAILGDGENAPDLGPIEDYRRDGAEAAGLCRRNVHVENRGSRADIARRSAAGSGWQGIVGR
jgi:hypothetical protein